MFRWCAYCQNLIGEAEPLNDYRVSHGVCSTCSRDWESHTAASTLRARTLFDMLELTGLGGSLAACEQAIDEALEFGLKPSDMIFGILHPALCHIGELWERGEISVAAEHRFTAFALGLIDRLRFSQPEINRPLIVLATHPDSLHDVGLRILQMVSWEHGVPCERIMAGTNEASLLHEVSARQPVVFGLSVSLMETIPAAVELAGTIARRLPASSRVVLGGQAFRRSEGFAAPEALTVIKRIDEFLVLLQSLNASQRDLQTSVSR